MITKQKERSFGISLSIKLIITRRVVWNIKINMDWKDKLWNKVKLRVERVDF